MDNYQDMYAVRVTNKRKASRAPKYLTGFNSRTDAESRLNDLREGDTYAYKVVYIREYFHDDARGHHVLTDVIEIPEYYTG